MTTHNPTVSTPDQASKPNFFCPVCGGATKVDWMAWSARPSGGYWLITCLKNPRECVIGQATASFGSLENRTFLADWKAPYLYELHTGEPVTAIDQSLANAIAWLMNQYTPAETVAFEQWVAAHYQDDDFALMIAAFVDGIAPTPDFSSVCDLYLAGR